MALFMFQTFPMASPYFVTPTTITLMEVNDCFHRSIIAILSCKGHTSLAQQESIVLFFLFGKNKLSFDISSDSCVNPNIPVIPSDY
ncbi:Uncharacterized protein TCM_044173 [Theobroma cacao]|uniref:Uncharacterized protein n=1 Tax=Theobroma cacao TaxID=3641 RepID=A0A061FWQ5_THECC|nr:Uncharacterized protein TCM_044173 [Theobroma cacao]